MAITATFGADFSGFVSETKNAEASLASLEGRGKQLSTTFTNTETNSERLRGSLQKFDGVLASLGVSIGPQIRAIEEIGTAAGKTATEIGAIGTAGLVVGAAFGGWQLGRMIAQFTGLDEAVEGAARQLFGFGDVAIEVAGAQLETITNAILKGADANITYADAVKYLRDKMNEHVDVMGSYFKRQQELNAETEKFIQQQEHWAAIMAELDTASSTFQGTLDGINGEVVEAVKFYLAAGVAQNTLAEAYNLTATQIRAVASAIKAEEEAERQLKEFRVDADKRQKEIVEATTRATNDAVIAKLKQKQADDAFLDTQLKEAQAQDAVNFRIGQVPATAAAAAQSINSLTTSYWAAIDAAAALAGIPDIGHRPPSLADPDWPRGGSGTSPFGGGPHPLRAMGGPVTSGRGYVVGERGPELFVPSSNGTIVPNGGGGKSVVNHIYVNGTAEDVARKVAAEILRTMMSGAKLSSS